MLLFHIMKHMLKERYTQHQAPLPSYALPQIPKPMPMLVPAFPRAPFAPAPFYYPVVNPQMLYRPIEAFRGAVLPAPTPTPTPDKPREYALDADSPPQKRRRCDDVAYDAHVECPYCHKHFNKVLYKRECSKCGREFCTAFTGPRPCCPHML